MTMTIRQTLRIYTGILIILPLCFSIASFYSFMRTSSIDDARELVTWETETLHASIERWMRHRVGDVEHIAAMPSVASGLHDPINQNFTTFLNSHTDFSNILLADSNGRIVLDPSGGTAVSIADRDYFITALKGTPAISDVLTSRISGEPVIIIAHPVRDDSGQVRAVVTAAITLQTLFRTFGISDGHSPWSPMMLQAGTRIPLQDMGKGTPRILPPTAEEQIVSVAVYSNGDGVRVVGASSPLKEGQWLLLREKPMTEILGGMQVILILLAAASLASLLVLAPLLRRLSSAIVKPAEAISTLSSQMLSGEYDHTCQIIDTHRTPVELATLYGNFCLMAEKVSRYVLELEIYTSTDPLTGLGNRRSLQKEGERIIEMCRRSGAECSCLVLDLDHFKRVNDTYGHPTGDVALQTVSSIIMGSIRKADFAARLGGEEFTVIASHTPTEQALVLAERIRADVESTPIIHDGHTFTMTISIGVAPVSASCDSSTTPLDDVISKADCALYKAKNNGRNRVEQWSAEDATMSCKHHP